MTLANSAAAYQKLHLRHCYKLKRFLRFTAMVSEKPMTIQINLHANNHILEDLLLKNSDFVISLDKFNL